MNGGNWKKLKDLLGDVLAIEPEAREAYLANAELTPEMRAEIDSLLSYEAEAEDGLNIPAIQFSKDFLTDEADQDPLLGMTIGPYKIIRELGQGGMGAVFLATRIDGKFEQQVAIKLLKRELISSSFRRRFEQERKILASLEHPNIARLLDAGTTDDGIPYFALEYVEGMPINEFCDRNELGLNARLDLFREVCTAVGFAHRNLVVHRDLKPSNVIVNQEGIPKLLDFGICEGRGRSQPKRLFSFVVSERSDITCFDRVKGNGAKKDGPFQAAFSVGLMETYQIIPSSLESVCKAETCIDRRGKRVCVDVSYSSPTKSMADSVSLTVTVLGPKR